MSPTTKRQIGRPVVSGVSLELDDRWRRIPRPGGWLSFERGWLNSDQALKNLETVVSLLQMLSAGLERIDNTLAEAMTGVNDVLAKRGHDDPPPQELTAFLNGRMQQITEVVRQCRFHGRGLLDGQSGVVGMGLGVVFVRGGPNTVSSPPAGYAVRISAFPSRAALTGGVTLHEDWLRAEKEIFLAEGENFVRYRPSPRETVQDFLQRLQEETFNAGLDLEIGMTSQRRLRVRHNQYGSQFKFKGMSQLTPLLSKRPGKLEWSGRGRDIQGTLDDEPAFGIGRLLIGYLDNARTSELAVMWRGGRLGPGRTARVHVVQNGIRFQAAEDKERPLVTLSIPSFHPTMLGRWLETHSDLQNLADLRTGSWAEVQDCLHLLFAVSCEMEDWRNRVDGWIRRYQSQALACLRRGETPVRNDGGAGEVADVEHMANVLRQMLQNQA